MESLCYDMLEVIRDYIPEEYDRLAFCKAVGLEPCKIKNPRFVSDRPNLVLFVCKCDWFKEYVDKMRLCYSWLYYVDIIINKEWFVDVFKEYKVKLFNKVCSDMDKIKAFDQVTVSNIVSIMSDCNIEKHISMEEKYIPLLKETIPRTKDTDMYIYKCLKWSKIYPKDRCGGTLYRAKLSVDYENLERFNLHKCHGAIIKAYERNYWRTCVMKNKNRKMTVKTLPFIGELIVKYDVFCYHRIRNLCLFRKILFKAIIYKDYEVTKYLVKQLPSHYEKYKDSMTPLLFTPCKDSRWLYKGLSPHCSIEVNYYNALLTTPKYLEYLIKVHGPDKFHTTFHNYKRGVLKYNAEHNTVMLDYLLDLYKITTDYKHGVLEGLALNMTALDGYILQMFYRLKINPNKVNRRRVYVILKSFRPYWFEFNWF